MKSPPPDLRTAQGAAWHFLLSDDLAATEAALRAVPAASADHRRLQAYLAQASGRPQSARPLLEGIPLWQRTELDCLYLDGVYRALQNLEDQSQWLAYLDFLLTQGNTGAALPLFKKPPASLEDSPALAVAWLRFRYVSGTAARTIVEEANQLIREASTEAGLYLTLGQALIDLHEPASAWRALELGRRLDPASTAMAFHAARAAEYLGDVATALSLYLSATESSGGNPAHALGAARLLKMAGGITDAQYCLGLATDGLFHPLSQLLYALTPHVGETGPREPDLLKALTVEVECPLNTGLFFTQFCGYPGFSAFAGLPDRLREQVSRQLLALFPPIGYSRSPDRRNRLAAKVRIGVLMPDLSDSETSALEEVLCRWGKRSQAAIFIFPTGQQVLSGNHGWHTVPLRGVNVVRAQQMILDAALDILVLAAPVKAPLAALLSLARLAPCQVLLSTAVSSASSRTVDRTYSATTVAGALDLVLGELPSPSGTPGSRLPPSFVPAIAMEQACAEAGGQWVLRRPAKPFSIPGAMEVGRGGVLRQEAITMKSISVGHGRIRDIDVHHGESAFISPHFHGVLHDHSFLHDNSRIASIPPIHGWLYSWRLLEEEVDNHFLLQPHRRTCTLPRAIVLRGKASTNYFHWLFDVLPQLESILANKTLEDWPLLIDQGLHPNLEAALRLLIGQDRLLLRQPFGTCLRIEDAVIPVGGNRIPLSLQPGARFVPEDYAFCPESIDFLRGRMLSSALSEPGQHLYLKRTGAYRKLVNEQEIEAQFTSQGFQVVDTSSMTLADQIATFSRAEVIAGPTGAAFANILFAPRDCRIILFTHEACGHHFFSNLAGAIGQRFMAVIGFSIPGSHIEDHQRDYFLPPSFARQALVQP